MTERLLNSRSNAKATLFLGAPRHDELSPRRSSPVNRIDAALPPDALSPPHPWPRQRSNASLESVAACRFS